MTYEAPPAGDRPPQGPQPQKQRPHKVRSQDGTTRRGGFLGFMTSLPGVLTAVGGLVTAATGGIGLYLHHDDDLSRGGDTYTIIEPAPVPAGDGQVDTQG